MMIHLIYLSLKKIGSSKPSDYASVRCISQRVSIYRLIVRPMVCLTMTCEGMRLTILLMVCEGSGCCGYCHKSGKYCTHKKHLRHYQHCSWLLELYVLATSKVIPGKDRQCGGRCTFEEGSRSINNVSYSLSGLVTCLLSGMTHLIHMNTGFQKVVCFVYCCFTPQQQYLSYILAVT